MLPIELPCCGKPADTADDAILQDLLDSAVDYVETQRFGDFNFTNAPGSLAPPPPRSLAVGTVQLAIRWHTLRGAPMGVVDMGELGVTRIPSIPQDLQAQLGIGRYRSPMV